MADEQQDSNALNDAVDIVREARAAAGETSEEAKKKMQEILKKSQQDLAASLIANKFPGLSKFAAWAQSDDSPDAAMRQQENTCEPTNQSMEYHREKDKESEPSKRSLHDQSKDELGRLEILPGVTWTEYAGEIGNPTQRFKHESLQAIRSFSDFAEQSAREGAMTSFDREFGIDNALDNTSDNTHKDSPPKTSPEINLGCRERK